MIVDAIKVFLRRILNQKQAINKYAKMGSGGFLGKRERGREKFICFKRLFFFPEETLLVREEFWKVRGKSKPFPGLSRPQDYLKGKGLLT